MVWNYTGVFMVDDGSFQMPTTYDTSFGEMVEIERPDAPPAYLTALVKPDQANPLKAML